MGFLDRFKKTPPQTSSERLMPFEYSFECCGTAQKFVTQIPIMEDGHNSYVGLKTPDTGKDYWAKLPVAVLKANQQGEYTLEGLADSVQELTSGLANGRLDELMTCVECQKCGRQFLHIMAVGLILNEQGQPLMVQRTGRGGVHVLPYAVLDYEEDRERTLQGSFRLHSIA